MESMNCFSEALYNDMRNAVLSWQGYEYQGNVALYVYLDTICKLCINENDEQVIAEKCNGITVKIEWLEDFVLIKNEQISDIYQVKSTLNKENLDEVIANFIIQYVFLSNNTIRWHIIYDESQGLDYDAKPSKKEFEELYKKYIEKTFVAGITKLLGKRDVQYWKENLNLREKTEIDNKCKAYIRNLLDIQNLKYDTVDKINIICNDYLQEILNKCRSCKDLYEGFSDNLIIEKMDKKNTFNECKKIIEDLLEKIPCNSNLYQQDILEKLCFNFKEKLSKIKNRKENFYFKHEDLLESFRDEKNEIEKWNLELNSLKEEILSEYVKPECRKCIKYNTNLCDNKCIYSQIRNWNMYNLIDDISLEYPIFCVESARININNKISNPKTEILMDIIESLKEYCTMLNNDIVVRKDNDYFVSNVGKGKKTLDRLLMYFWEHTRVYKDYEFILTDGFEYELSEDNISFLKENGSYEDDEQSTTNKVSFLETRRTEFVDYNKEVK